VGAILGGGVGNLFLAPGMSLPAPTNPPVEGKDINFRWGTVTDDSPLRVRLDGEDTELPMTPESLIEVRTPAIGTRVWVQIFGQRVIILGASGGLLAVPTARAADCLYAGAGDALTIAVPFRVPVSVAASTGAGMTVSSGGRLAIPVTGLWEMSACARVFGAVGRIVLDLRANAAGSGTGGTRLASQVEMVDVSSALSPDCLMSPRMTQMTAGDYIELFLTSSVSGNSINAGSLAGLTGFTARLVNH